MKKRASNEDYSQEFACYKAQILRNLAEGIDFSPKGSIDAPILELVGLVNSHHSYVTTSSCSGRLSVSYHLDDDNKKGVNWILVRHGLITKEEVLTCIAPLSSLSVKPRLVFLKCEAFIVHICCANLEAAKALHALAMQCGFRESGISIASKKIMVAIRTSSFNLDVPLALYGRFMLSIDDLGVIVDEANACLLHNFARTEKLLIALKDSPLFPLTLEYTNTDEAELGPISSRISSQSNRLVQVSMGNTSFLLYSGGKVSLFKPRPILEVFCKGGDKPLQILEEGETKPLGRWNHIWLLVTSSESSCEVLLSGGRDAEQVLADNYLLHLTLTDYKDEESRPILICTWRQLTIAHGNEQLLQRFSHAACLLASQKYEQKEFKRILLHGGLFDIKEIVPTPDSTFLYLEVNAFTSQCAVREIGRSEKQLCGHNLVTLPGKSVLLIGGVSLLDTTPSPPSLSFPPSSPSPPSAASLYPTPSVFDYYDNEQGALCLAERRPCLHVQRGEVACWQCLSGAVCLSSPLSSSLSTVCCLVGGSSVCLAFGPHLCRGLRIQGGYGRGAGETGEDKKGEGREKQEHRREERVEQTWGVLLVPVGETKRFKTALERIGGLEKGVKIFPLSPQQLEGREMVRVDQGGKEEEEEGGEKERRLRGYTALPLTLSWPALEQKLKDLSPSPFSSLSPIYYTSLPSPAASSPSSTPSSSSTPPLSMAERKKTAQDLFTRIFHAHEVPLSSLPTKFERVGDILVLPEQTFSSERGAALLSLATLRADLLLPLSEIFQVSRIAWKRRIDTSPRRESRTLLLFVVGREGEKGGIEEERDGWVVVTENALRFHFNICRVMFCSGNNTERMRMGRLSLSTEVVVDLYCGIGYYSLPLLVHSRAHLLYACEWNPPSLEALERNLQEAGVRERCVVLPGDNQVTAPSLGAVADRVLLGLLPSSRAGWGLAAKVLKNTGGIFHVHENLFTRELGEKVEEVRGEMERLLRGEGKEMRVLVEHVEEVKSYAPRVSHFVIDLRCTPL